MDLQGILRGDNVIRLDGRPFGETRTYRPSRGMVLGLAAAGLLFFGNVFPAVASAGGFVFLFSVLPIAMAGLFVLYQLKYNWISVNREEVAWRDLFATSAVPLQSVRWITIKVVRNGKNRTRMLEVEYFTPERTSVAKRKAIGFYANEVVAQIAQDIKANNPAVSVDTPLQELIDAARAKQSGGDSQLEVPMGMPGAPAVPTHPNAPVVPEIIVAAPHAPRPQYLPADPMAPPGVPSSIGGEDRRWMLLAVIAAGAAVYWWVARR